jgi:low temperature requirement protein LtrA
VAFIAARSILVAMYLRARRHVPETRELVTGYVVGMTAAIAVWTVSLVVPEEIRIILWTIGLSIDFYNIWRLRKIQAKVPLSTSHLPERFGLFTILVLGESIASVVAGLEHEGWLMKPFIGAILGVAIATGLWWIYFDNVEGSVVRRKKGQRTAWKPTVWIYSHLPLAFTLTAAGIGLEFIVTQHLDTGERMVVTLGVAGALVVMGVIHIATEAGPERRDDTKARIRFGAAGLVLVLGLVGGDLSPNVFAALIAIIVVAQVAVDTFLEPRDQPDFATGIDLPKASTETGGTE